MWGGVAKVHTNRVLINFIIYGLFTQQAEFCQMGRILQYMWHIVLEVDILY